MSAAFSPIITVGAMVFPVVTSGIMLASAMRSPSIPWTLQKTHKTQRRVSKNLVSADTVSANKWRNVLKDTTPEEWFLPVLLDTVIEHMLRAHKTRNCGTWSWVPASQSWSNSDTNVWLFAQILTEQAQSWVDHMWVPLNPNKRHQVKRFLFLAYFKLSVRFTRKDKNTCFVIFSKK